MDEPMNVRMSASMFFLFFAFFLFFKVFHSRKRSAGHIENRMTAR